MSADLNPPEGQISFKQEVARKATHTGALVIPAGYHLLALSRLEMLAIMIPIAILMVLIDISRLRDWAFYRVAASRFMSPLMRGHENAGDFSGATYILLSVCLTVALYDKPIAIAALAFIAVGDTFAALIGRRFGRHRFGRKSVEGSLGCLLGTLIVAFLVPGIPLSVAVFGAAVATAVEAVSFRIDDNITVPIVSGLAMTLLTRIMASI
ncbi:MAG: phosphatidate cytidylyltransferase [Candidatus Zixiibacteriota bacterium]|nr:MAG: phosphatidate cytidylyltransferase [candidate division Zixibacteria bacterium]